MQLPRKHCAFAGCTWATDPFEDRTSAMAAERALVDHLMEHDEELDYVASLLPSFDGVAVVPAQPKKTEKYFTRWMQNCGRRRSARSFRGGI